MKMQFLTIAALAVLFSPAKAQEGQAFSQLLNETSLSIPVPPLPDRGDQGSGAVSWDPSAPFSYHQRQALVLARGAGTVTLKNVRWGALPADGKSHRWETAVIRPALIEKAYYGIKTSGAGHSLLVFVFKKGGFVNSRGEESRALTIGAESFTREPGYSRTDDLLGRYPIGWNLTTLANYADFTVNSAGSPVELAGLNIPPAAQAELLLAALERMEQTILTPETHVLYANNCTTIAVSLVNRVLPEALRIAPKLAFAVNPDSAFPKKAVARYTRLGALSAERLELGRSNYNSEPIALY